MFKILMCNCYRYRLDQLDICYTYSFTFDDCGCSSDHEKFVLRCRQNFRPYNMSSICCSCADLNKDIICIHCKRLRYSLNNDTKRVCLKKEDLPEKFKLIKIDNYLKKYISADPHFFFCNEDNEIKSSLDSPDWDDFFCGKETM